MVERTLCVRVVQQASRSGAAGGSGSLMHSPHSLSRFRPLVAGRDIDREWPPAESAYASRGSHAADPSRAAEGQATVMELHRVPS
jgi:hypothetical protein